MFCQVILLDRHFLPAMAQGSVSVTALLQ